jgi:polyisoprenoid-binding protein YceI
VVVADCPAVPFPAPRRQADVPANRTKPWRRRVIGAVVIVGVLGVGGPFVYLQLIQDKAPAPLSLSTATTPTAGSTAKTASLAGTWKVGAGSIGGYRVKETLLGQSATAAGRTSAVTGQITIAGTTVAKAQFSVDMTSVKTDNSRRDDQFQGRIMETSTYPTATFALTAPINLAPVPKDGVVKKYAATGTFILHGTTKTVTFTLSTKRTGNVIQVQGSLPIKFSDYNINNPSAGPASVGNTGTMEFLLHLQKT